MRPASSRIVRRVLGFLWITVLRLTGCLRFAKWRLRKQGAVVVLMCHRVLGDPAFWQTNSPDDIVVRERTFRDLIDYITREYVVVALRDAKPGTVGRKLQLVLTFDDGWSDNYIHVFPLVHQHHLPITIFLCSGLTAREMPFWPERIAMLLTRANPSLPIEAIKSEIESLKTASPSYCEEYETSLAARTGATPEGTHPAVDSTFSWEQAAEMQAAGIDFGSHTHTHQILTHLTRASVISEVQTSKSLIEKALSRRCDTFTYPNGNWSRDVRQAVADAGYTFALTTEPGAWTVDTDLLAIPRLNISEENIVGWTKHFSSAVFEYYVFWRAWRALRRHTPFLRLTLALLRLHSDRKLKVQGNLS